MDTSTTPKRLLALTDDRDLIHKLEREINRRAAAEIIVASDGLQLVEEQAIRRTSIIILDADVLQARLQRLITILRTVDTHCKIVLLLTPDNLPLCEQVLPLGMVWYFFKPVPVENTAGLVCSFLNVPINESG